MICSWNAGWTEASNIRLRRTGLLTRQSVRALNTAARRRAVWCIRRTLHQECIVEAVAPVLPAPGRGEVECVGVVEVDGLLRSEQQYRG